MVDNTSDQTNTGVTIDEVNGGIKDAFIGGRDVIGNILVTGDHSQVFVGDYARLRDAYISPQSVFERVDLEHFTGREWLLAEVDTFLQNHDRGYFILEASAGLGKTTFMAWLVKERHYIHHFSELAPGPENIGVALMNLAAQLAIAFELKPEGVLSGAAAERPDYLYDLLNQVANQRRNGEKIVLVIDALDQAGTLQNQNVLGLPASLPEGVYVIVSQRPVPVALQIDTPRTPRYPYLLTAESDNNQADIRRFLERAATWPGITRSIQANGYISEQFVSVLLSKSHGVWIYLHFVVAELEQNAQWKENEPPTLQLDRLPDGLTQYYVHYWQAWRDDDEDKWYNLYLPLLTTLAAAQEAITLERLVAWSSLQTTSPGLSRLFTERWRPFLVIAGQGPQARYRFYHATLQEFFAGQSGQTTLTSAEQAMVAEFAEATRTAHERLVERYLQAWGGLDDALPGLRKKEERELDEGYGLRYLALHLEAAGRNDDLHCLLRLEWIYPKETPSPTGVPADLQKQSQAQDAIVGRRENVWHTIREMVGQTDGYLADVTRAWGLTERHSIVESAADPLAQNGGTAEGWPHKSLGLQCRYALIVASFNSLAYHILPELLTELVKKKIWLPQQGLAYARQVPNLNRRADALAALAPHLSIGQMQEALTTAKSIQDSSSRAKALDTLLITMAVRLAEQGQMQEALTTTKSIQNSFSRAKALVAVAQHLSGTAQEQVLQEALTAAKSIQDSSARAYALVTLTARLAELGQLQEALTTAKSIESNSSRRAKALVIVAQHLSGAAQEQVLQEALATARSIQNSFSRAKALIAVAQHLSGTAQEQVLQEALTTARSIQDSSARAEALGTLAPHLSIGQMQEALTTAKNIQDSYSQAATLDDLAARLAELGVALPEQDNSWMGRRLTDLAARLAELGQLQEALTTARSIHDSFDRAKTLVAVASHLSGTVQEQVLQEALTSAKNIQDNSSRAYALVVVAPYLSGTAQEQVLQEALTTAKNIQNSYPRIEVLVAVAPYLSGAAQEQVLQEALTTAKDIQDGYFRAEALAALASQLIESSHSGAKALAAPAPYLSGTAREQVLQEALTTARSIEDSYSRAEALAALASRLVELSFDDLYAIWCKTLHVLSSRTRADLLADLAALVGLIVHLGGASAIVEAAQAIQDVGRWWP